MILFSHYYLYQNGIIDFLTPLHVEIRVAMQKKLNLGFQNFKTNFRKI